MVSIHAPVKGATDGEHDFVGLLMFQSTHP